MIAPHALCTQLIHELSQAQLRSEPCDGVAHVLATHFSEGTTLGTLVRARHEAQDALVEEMEGVTPERILEAFRAASGRFSVKSLTAAYSLALKESLNFISTEPQPNEWDSLLNGWLSGNIRESVLAERHIIESSRAKEDEDGIAPEMLGLVTQRAMELLESVVREEGLGDDPRQIELLRVWGNALDERVFAERAKEMLSESKQCLSGAALQEGVVGELARESLTACDDLLSEKYDWNKTDTLQSVMLVLESERTLRKRLRND